MYVFELALREMADWEAVSDAAEEDAEVINPGMVVFAGASSK